MISLDLARQLLDFEGGRDGRKGRLSPERAEEQLQGAVAIYNTLQERQFAYLADEVGLGKTYVALGAFALFRHFSPSFRLLVIAPKRNIQEKWIKELRNFTRNNVRFPDLRVRAIHDEPARPPVYCENLYEFARETSLDPERDFFLRLTSFGFGLSTEASEGWQKRRDRIRDLLPWIDEDVFDLRSKERFKANYARAVCCAIPEFDLVIVDEGHNLKAGLQKNAAIRNRLVSLVFGNDREELTVAERRRFPHYGPRAKRVLFLSATPLEDDYRQIWNQLDVFGLADDLSPLAERNVDEEEKRKIVSSFLIRRVSSIPSAGTTLTKNLYRREWRRGGVDVHDEPLPKPDDRQRLVVALVQKKVSELLATEKFNHSFQIGMLASFESFFQTTAVRTDDESEATFDDADQTEDPDERQGIDVGQVNRLAQSYRRKFGQHLPHPKMDALVASLKPCFDTGQKALVFVRRVASVKEIRQKLEAEYDAWLFSRLRRELRPELLPRTEELIARYESERSARRVRISDVVAAPVDDDRIDDDAEATTDTGGIETFFAWFFRGKGPRDVLSAANIAERFTESQYSLSSFFADNYVAELLGVAPGHVFSSLLTHTGWQEEHLRAELEARAGLALKADQKRRTHLDQFFAFQRAAVSILADVPNSLQEQAKTILSEVFPSVSPGGRPAALGIWLETPTFFTSLRERPQLLHQLWPQDASKEYAATFRRRELRRELLATMFRRGHAFIDLFITIANLRGSLDTAGAQVEDLDNSELTRRVLDLFEIQSKRPLFRAFQELSAAATNFDLILDVNGPRLWDAELRLEEVPRELGQLLRRQQPVGGMFGEVSKQLVTQFRMPGYPFVLVTTDLLQEGEDLHLFCSDIYHYGISWMPSSMEQRIGRIDRVRSQTERKLTQLVDHQPEGHDLLQVYYPYLAETVEVFQVNRVLERVDRFIQLMHEQLGIGDEQMDRRLNLLHEMQHGPRRSQTTSEPLRSAFPVRRELLRGAVKRLAVTPDLHDDLLQHFWHLQELLARKHGVVWHHKNLKHARFGQVSLAERKQAFTVFLHTIEGYANVRCVSPVGQIDVPTTMSALSRAARDLPARVAAVYDPRFHQYNITAELDVLLSRSAIDEERLWWLIRSTGASADYLEKVLLEIDHETAAFSKDLAQEPHFER